MCEARGDVWWREGVQTGCWWGDMRGKNQCGTHTCEWEDDIRIYLLDTGQEGVDWIHLAEDTDNWRVVVNAVMNIQLTQNSGYLFTSYEATSLSRRTSLPGVMRVTPR